jgi:CRP-like cAMP-binding protein
MAAPTLPSMHTPPDVESCPPARTGNGLLAALPEMDRAMLQPQLEAVELVRGQVLHEAGAALRHVYFPATCIVSLVASMRDGASVEVAMVGNEGMVGVSAFLGGGLATTSAIVQGPGQAWRLGAESMAAHANGSEPVRQVMFAYTQALFAHMAQTSACHCHHGLEQQLCRWLLLHLDRRPGDEVRITQERIAAMLGVRREGVTGGALKLQKAGLIRYVRGRIAILDRPGLEALACECYAFVRSVYERLGTHAPAPRRCAVEQTTPLARSMLGASQRLCGAPP